MFFDDMHISDIYVELKQDKIGHLYLIFTEPIGVEVFSFLKSEEITVDSIHTALLL